MISISIKSDIEKALKKLNDVQKKQVPFAVAKGLTLTAQQVKAEEEDQLKRDTDRPIPFTQRAFYVLRATKASPVAVIGIKDIQGGYLSNLVEGGTRKPKRKALIAPADIKLNTYGNIPKNKIKALMRRSDTFTGTIGRTSGIWQHVGKNGKPKRQVKLLVRFKDEQRYKRQFDFYGAARRVVALRLTGNIDAALNEALRTAR